MINIKNGQTQISFIDEFNNIQTINFPINKLKIESDCKNLLPKNWFYLKLNFLLNI